ncbi:MAG: metallophosphoesterase, partial [bacterium]
DLVLSGHDHVYSRTYPLRAGKIAAKKKKGTVYVISVSCPKAYDIGKINAGLMAKTGTQAQLFQVITIDPKRLNFKSYTADGGLYDEFEVRK